MSPQPKGMLEMRKSIKLTAFATMMVAGLATTALYAQEAQTPDKQSPMMEHDGNSGMGDMQGMMGMMKMMIRMIVVTMLLMLIVGMVRKKQLVQT